MKIGLIAMSGVRVKNAELSALGVTLPGLSGAERSSLLCPRWGEFCASSPRITSRFCQKPVALIMSEIREARRHFAHPLVAPIMCRVHCAKSKKAAESTQTVPAVK